jgi:hypothetical protein
MARHGQLLFSEELRGNCAGLTITIKTRIDRLRELQKEAKKEAEGPRRRSLEADPPSTPSSMRDWISCVMPGIIERRPLT